MNRKLVLLDGNSITHRAFHALPPMDADGTPTNAVFGFFSMLLRALRDEQAEYLAVAFDPHGPTFRHAQYADYKAGRPPTPEDLRVQFPILREILQAMGVPILSVDGYEADDMLGTVSRRVSEAGDVCVLVTGDRDAFQLAGERVSILYTRRGATDVVRVTPEYIQETYGVSPERLIDIKGLMGDASDNLPGIPGIGEKTAIRLISRYGTLENALAEGAKQEKGKLQERLIQGRESAEMSKRLATIARDAPVEFDMDSCRADTMPGGLGALQKYKLVKISDQVRKLFAVEEAPETRETHEVREIAPDALEAILSTAREAQLAFGGDAFFASVAGAHYRVSLGGDLLAPGAAQDDIARAASALFASAARLTVHDAKAFYALGLPVSQNIFDTKLAAYAINPQLGGGFSLQAACGQVDVPCDPAAPTADMSALRQRQEERMRADGVEGVFSRIEMPLCAVLNDMEHAGFLVDGQELARLGEQYRAKLSELTARIYELAGESFNINSPKQLGELLFEKMGLPGGKKTQRGYSTDVQVLESLAGQFEIAAQILEYRKVHKLNSTYIEALLRLRGADGNRHGPHQFAGAQPAKHPRAQRDGARNPARVHRAGRVRVGGRGLFAD